jgi:thiamine-phosphate pyrophosphorylase
LQAEDEQADYVTLSPFGATERSRPRPRLTPGRVEATLARLNAPVVALGGIDLRSVPCLPAGLCGIAVIRALADASDPEAAAVTLRGAVEHRWPRELLDRGRLDVGLDPAPS